MQSRLFGVVTGPDINAAQSIVQNNHQDIDGIELRLDCFTSIDFSQLKAFIQQSSIPVMITLRSRSQGGEFQGDEEDRMNQIEKLCSLGPTYIDLEYDVPTTFRKHLFHAFPEILFISSYHDFTTTPDNLEAVLEKMRTPYTHLYKIAVTAHSCVDALRLLLFVQEHSKKERLIGISMGESYAWTRILAPIVGSYLTYGVLSGSERTAPGQLTARELQSTYYFRRLNPTTRIYALLGNPVDKSLGAVIHNAVFQEQSIHALYVKIALTASELPLFFTLMRKLPFDGFSVTMPLKEDVIPFLEEASKRVQKIGACNTLVFRDEKIYGDNTDGVGAINALEQECHLIGKQVVFIGAGGAAKALVFEAAQRGAKVTVINRTSEKAVELAKAVHGRGGGWELLATMRPADYDILINCIPDGNAIDESLIHPGKIAMDIVYVPKLTPFLQKALQKDCKVVYGYEMFVRQAVEQLKLWFPDQIHLEKAYYLIKQTVEHFLL